MKLNRLITTVLATTALFAVSCSTPRSAQNHAVLDDVYHTTAKAKEYIAPVVIQNTSTEYADDSYYSKSDPDYDMDYSSRIDRFYYGNPNRSYYDPYYNYYGYHSFGFDPYGYNSFYRPYRYGFGLNGYFGSYYNNWYNPFYSWSYYGSMYYNNFWGPYSYYNPYGYGGGFGWGGGWYGGGWAGNVIVKNNENYRPRPNRGGENGTIRANGSVFPGPSRGDGSSNNAPRTRAEMYNPNYNGNNAGRPNGSNSAPNRPGSSSDGRPSRGNSNTPSRPEGSQSRPTRSNDAPQQSRPTYSPPAQSSPPPSSRGGSSSSSGSSSRPTRGGGR